MILRGKQMEIYIALMVIISLIIIALILITVGNKKQLDLIITDKPDLSRYANKTRIKD